MASLREKTWTWGYVIPESGEVLPGGEPGDVPFVGKCACSLETAADYLGTPNVVSMNSNHYIETLTPDYLDPLASCGRVVCGLTHGAYEEAARQVSALSQQYRTIAGGLIDDFLDFHGPSKDMTPDELRGVYESLKSANAQLPLYVVRYTWQDQHDLEPYLPYLDVINLWVWVGNTHDWQVKMGADLEAIRRCSNKPVLLGLYMHDYGGTGQAIAMDVLELQTRKAVAFAKAGLIEGFVILMSAWFDHEDHRPQVQWLKGYLDWACGTWTPRAV